MNTELAPSLENGIAGNYSFNIKAIFGEAWEKTKGMKGRFWKALLLILLITLVTSLISVGIDYLIMGPPPSSDNVTGRPVFAIAQMIFSIFLTTPLFAGMLMLCIKHCAGKVVPATSLFEYLPYWKKLWVYPVFMTAITLLHMIFMDMGLIQFLLTLLTIFILVTYAMFIPLIVDKNLSVRTALEASRKTIFHHWFKTLWFTILIGLISVASLLTFGIAYIWTMPWIYNSIALLYRNMFGITQAK
jgi:hypothetical protein